MTIRDKKKLPGDYGVGFAKPPKYTQFKKGQSGNPKGRPKNTLNLATVVNRIVREQVVINEGGQRKTVTKFEAAVKQVANKAASGDLSALRHLLALVQFTEQPTGSAAPMTGLDHTDEKV